MNKINWDNKASKIIFIILAMLIAGIVGLKLLIKDIKHNKDVWYFVENGRYDFAEMQIEEYVDRRFLRKPEIVKYSSIEIPVIYTEPEEKIELLLNSKDLGFAFNEIIDIDITIENLNIETSKWNETSKKIEFKAPNKIGKYKYQIEVTYDNKDKAKYYADIEVTTEEKIIEIKQKNIEVENKNIKDVAQDINKMDLEIMGASSLGTLNHKFTKLDSKLAPEDKILESMKNKNVLNLNAETLQQLVFSIKENKYILKEDIQITYKYIDTVPALEETTNEAGEKQITPVIKKTENQNLTKNANGIYEIKLPKEKGKYVCIVEALLDGNITTYALNISTATSVSEQYKNLRNKYAKAKVEDTKLIEDLVEDIVKEKVLTIVPSLEKVNVIVNEETKQIDIEYYYLAKETDPEILYQTEDFKTYIKEEVSMMLYDIVDGIEKINNINYTNQGKNKLQHVYSYTRRQIKQLFNRV
ncbi:MAG: hypothetical protein RR662_02525 [Clostridia bacterium]